MLAPLGDTENCEPLHNGQLPDILQVTLGFTWLLPCGASGGMIITGKMSGSSFVTPAKWLRIVACNAQANWSHEQPWHVRKSHFPGGCIYQVSLAHKYISKALKKPVHDWQVDTILRWS